MNDIQKNVLELLKASLFINKNIELPEDTDWKALFTEMKQQTIAAIPADIITSMECAPQNVRAVWLREAMQNVAISTRIAHEQSAVVTLLSAHGISSVVMKGTAAAKNYPKPEYRAMGDVDLLVRPEDFEKTCEVLEGNGYDLYRGALDGHHHAEYFKNDVMIEVHYKFNAGREEDIDAYLSGLLYQCFSSVEWIDAEGYRVPILPRLGNGLVILQHIANHLKGGLGLRQMMDWMMFVHREMDEKFWQAEFRPACEVLHLEKLAIVASEMCRIYLGLPPSSCTWYEGEEEKLSKELMEYVLLKGNFGRKAKKEERGVGVFSNRTVFDFLRSLQRNGKSHWEAYHKYPWLGPFAWIYQICRYIKLGLSRKNALKSVKEDYETASRRKRFFEQLDIDLENISHE